MRKAVDAGPVYLSLIVYWEVMLKSMKGNLDVGDPRQWWQVTMKALAAQALPLRAEQIDEFYNLAPIHKDSFDRMLIAQATVEEMTMVTTDEVVRSYRWERFKVL